MDWLIHSTAGFWTRLAVGAAIFATLAIIDYRRHGPAATRWREYLFLLACTFGAMGYGIANDFLTSTISWEYFYYGKELSAVLGPTVPPDPVALHWEAMKIGVKATWSVGLIVGVVLLIANNPHRIKPKLSYRQLLRLLPLVIVFAAAFAVVGGLLGSNGMLNWVSSDFAEMWRENTFRPSQFLAAWGVHLGGYIGGAIGTGIAVGRIRQKRSAAYAAGGAKTKSSRSGS